MTPSLIRMIKADLQANMSARGQNYKGFLLALSYRLAHAILLLPKPVKIAAFPYLVIYKIYTEFVLGCEIHWRAQIGPGLMIHHGYGLVIHSSSRIGANVTLRHGVTIGVRETFGESVAPTLLDDVDVGVGATLIGPIQIGAGAIIGAGAVVLTDVPGGALAVGVPARIVEKRPLT